MARFRSGRDGVLRAQLRAPEAEVLRRVVRDIGPVVADDDPSDPAVRRLFPDAYEDDDNAAAFRALVGQDLHASKREALATLERTLQGRGKLDVELTQAEADAWLTALNDLRLVLGERLEVTEDKMGAELDPRDPETPALAVLHWLGWLQELMLEALGAIPAGGEE